MKLNELKEIMYTVQEEIEGLIEEDEDSDYAVGVCEGVCAFVDIMSEIFEGIAEV